MAIVNIKDAVNRIAVKTTSLFNAVKIKLALKQDKDDPTLATTSKNIVGAINEVNSGFSTAITNINDRLDFKANTSLNNIDLGVQTEQQILASGLDGKLVKIPKSSLLSKNLTITYSDGTTEIVKVG